jgi:hypothetical protein
MMTVYVYLKNLIGGFKLCKNTRHSTNSFETIPRLRWGKEILEIINWLINLPIYTGKMYKNAPSPHLWGNVNPDVQSSVSPRVTAHGF